MPEQDSNTAATEGAGRTVLIAESSPALALLTRTLLTRWGFAVTATACDRSALQALENGQFDLVVIGATAPDAPLIADACSNGAPILALTTDDRDLAGAAASLRLPVDAASLRAGVDRCLNPATGSLDAEAIATLWGSTDSPVYHRIVRVFIGEVRDRVAKICALLETGDLPVIEIEAHSIKGAAANVGAHAIRDAAKRLETEAARRDSTAIPALTAALRHATEAGVAALERIMAAPGQS